MWSLQRGRQGEHTALSVSLDELWLQWHLKSYFCFEPLLVLAASQVRWFKDGSEIRKGKKYEIIAQGRQHILIIHKSVFDDEAEYECDAKTSKSSGMLTVVGKNKPTVTT